MAIDTRTAEDRREYRKEYYIKNQERLRAYHIEKYQKNKEHIQTRNREYEKEFIKTPKGKYSVQKRKAKRRGIEWQLTFEDWWEIWQQSGKWEERGWGKYKYAMCRHGDSGPYSRENVFIDTNAGNLATIPRTRGSLGRFLPKEKPND
jgi:hypothetical protein